jgi:trigger factor
MEQRGLKVKDLPMQPEWFVDQARRRVSLGLILSEIVKQQRLQAKPAQVKAMVEEAAQSYDHPQEVVRWYYAQPERLRATSRVRQSRPTWWTGCWQGEGGRQAGCLC